MKGIAIWTIMVLLMACVAATIGDETNCAEYGVEVMNRTVVMNIIAQRQQQEKDAEIARQTQEREALIHRLNSHCAERTEQVCQAVAEMHQLMIKEYNKKTWDMPIANDLGFCVMEALFNQSFDVTYDMYRQRITVESGDACAYFFYRRESLHVKKYKSGDVTDIQPIRAYFQQLEESVNPPPKPKSNFWCAIFSWWDATC